MFCHACPKGGYQSIIDTMKSENLSAALLSEVCHNVSTELHLKPMIGEVMSGLSANTQDGILDIAADGF